jgi:hypothetical protein
MLDKEDIEMSGENCNENESDNENETENGINGMKKEWKRRGGVWEKKRGEEKKEGRKERNVMNNESRLWL